MAFESLSDKLQNIFRNLTGKGRLSEADVKAGLREVKLALLEADVNFKVVKDFIKKVQERSVVSEPIRLTISSLTILMTICPGFRPSSTSVPTDRS